MVGPNSDRLRWGVPFRGQLLQADHHHKDKRASLSPILTVLGQLVPIGCHFPKMAV
jgi:hypothetical protein